MSGAHNNAQSEQNARALLNALAARKFDFFSGVPCSLLGALFRSLETLSIGAKDSLLYVPAVREDLAIGLAAGASMSGRKTVVMMQNSGLGVCYNALASLNDIYRIPTFVVVSWRGEGGVDAPEHIRMGQIMTGMLDALDLPWIIASPNEIDAQVQALDEKMTTSRRPVVLIVKKGVFE